ncbi:ATP-binding protein [Helicobacter kayseriensis]|uniref:ATP-binding protein n=1 Tax=Helicobacter kayseriensis TaxID=2905877 RepID=UPI001E3D0347|nr:ATP-binding protein [Helicobacter kayseriensis]MCE3047277.1 ATP-binding protein [Helicobacter kayseriensis]MCE3048648.1 ATP-binding protein [Helicobacter kayseriensis]
MKHYLNFLHTKPIEESLIFESLKCSKKEAEILQYMAKMLLEGENEFRVLSLLECVFDPQNLFEQDRTKLTDYLPYIKNLLDLGWITQSTLGSKTLLELLGETIYLSHSFLKLLENGSLENLVFEDRAYEDHLEYLKDQFLRIDLLVQLANLRFSHKADSPSISKITYRLNALNQQIAHRIKLTAHPFELIKMIEDSALTQKEQIIFFALLREEYYGGESNLREMNALLELISHDEYDRIKNRSLLDDKGTLLEREWIGYDEFLSPFGGISRTYFIAEEILQKIIHPNKHKKKTKNVLSTLIQEQNLFELLEPKKNLSEIILPQPLRQTLEHLLKQMDSKVIARLKAWGIKDKKTLEAKIIFYGSAGTGKTLTALALAKSLKRPLLHLDCSKILSMYVGESEKNVRKIFDSYDEIAQKSKNEPILLLNEADQFLSTRTIGGGGSEKMHNQMQNIFLEQIEKFEGILIATTNLLETLDPAFSRRFNYKIEFKRPTIEQRREIWELHLPKHAEFAIPQSALIDNLSKYDLSGGQIALIVKNTAYKVATREVPIFDLQDFIEEIQKEKEGNFDGEKNMGFVL